MAKASSIAFLQPPPSWGLASSADADWVIRQRMREEYGSTKKKKLNRHQRKKKLKLSAAEASREHTAHHVPEEEEKKPRLSNLTSIQKSHLASLIQEEEPQDEEIQKQVNVQQRKKYTEQPEEELIEGDDGDVVDKVSLLF